MPVSVKGGRGLDVTLPALLLYTMHRRMHASCIYVLGPLLSCRSYNSDDIKTAATGADLVIVCLGTGNSVEAEGNDRADIELPGQQFQLLKDAVSFSSQCVCGCIYRCMPVSVFWDSVHVCLLCEVHVHVL